MLRVQSDAAAGTGPSFDGFDAVPIADIALQTSAGLVPAASTGTPIAGPLSGTYYFAVSATTTSAQIQVQGATVSAVEYPDLVGPGAKLTQLTFGPMTIDLVEASTATTAPSSLGPSGTRPSQTTASHAQADAHNAARVAAAGAGLAVFVVVVPLWVRRRRYRRADREGRVVVESPPGLPRPVPAQNAAPDTRVDNGTAGTGAVVVAVIGPLEFHGLPRPTDSAPVQELLSYLALHPGRTFTSVELRNAIWAEPRREPSPESFHNYVSKLRKALPDGVLERAGYHYRLSGLVSSDWAAFQAHVGAAQDRASHLRGALALVRGRPFAGTAGRDAHAYNWATTEFVPTMELAIERAAHELVTLALADGDVEHAEWALSVWPPSEPWSILLDGDALRVASARGGPAEVARALVVVRARLGADAAGLEDLARELGWDG